MEAQRINVFSTMRMIDAFLDRELLDYIHFNTIKYILLQYNSDNL